MDGQAGVAYEPWAVVSIRRRNYRPSVEVQLENGRKIRLISLSGVMIPMDEYAPKLWDPIRYYQMNYTALCALYDAVGDDGERDGQ